MHGEVEVNMNRLEGGKNPARTSSFRTQQYKILFQYTHQQPEVGSSVKRWSVFPQKPSLRASAQPQVLRFGELALPPAFPFPRPDLPGFPVH